MGRDGVLVIQPPVYSVYKVTVLLQLLIEGTPMGRDGVLVIQPPVYSALLQLLIEGTPMGRDGVLVIQPPVYSVYKVTFYYNY